MSSLEEQLVNRIVTEAAKELARGIVVDNRELIVVLAEILASNYQQTAPGYNKRHYIFHDAEELAKQKIANVIKTETMGV